MSSRAFICLYASAVAMSYRFVAAFTGVEVGCVNWEGFHPTLAQLHDLYLDTIRDSCELIWSDESGKVYLSTLEEDGHLNMRDSPIIPCAPDEVVAIQILKVKEITMAGK